MRNVWAISRPSIVATHLLLGPLLLELGHHVGRRLRVLAKRLLDDDPVDALGRVAVGLEPLRDLDEDARRQGHVEDAVALVRLGAVGLVLDLGHVLVELLEALGLVVLAGDVGAHAEELVELLLLRRQRLDVRGRALVEFLGDEAGRGRPRRTSLSIFVRA